MPQRSDQELVSWDVIGAELGMTGGGALKIYNQALKKIRKHLKNNPAQAEAAHNLLIDREPRHYGHEVNFDGESGSAERP